MSTATDTAIVTEPHLVGPAYNGWTNRETWIVALWMDSDPRTQDGVARILRTNRNPIPAAKSIEDYVREVYDRQTEDAGGMVQDAVRTMLARVNWAEIVRNRE